MTDDESRFSATFPMPAPPATVWRHLREPDLLRRWFGWHGPEFDAEIAGLAGGFAVVEREGHAVTIGDHRMELCAVDAGTELRITRVGEPDEHGVEVDEGWVTFLQQLRYVLTVQPGGCAAHRRAPPAGARCWSRRGGGCR